MRHAFFVSVAAMMISSDVVNSAYLAEEPTLLGQTQPVHVDSPKLESLNKVDEPIDMDDIGIDDMSDDEEHPATLE